MFSAVCFSLALILNMGMFVTAINVETTIGTIRGNVQSYGQTSVHQFLGVPYAEPPVGELRFKPPRPKLAVNDGAILSAERRGRICPQDQEQIKFFNFTEDSETNWETDEDCLYLNIFVPSQSDRSLPVGNLAVMVWIHSGGWSWGSGSHYDGRWLPIHGDVILVTFNYRLGILGFMKTDDGLIPANNGLRDQILALKWIRDNIPSFGGDPERITIFGESAGGASVTYLAMIPEARGLFQRVIAQSGVPSVNWANNTALSLGNLTAVVAEMAGCPLQSSQLLTCLNSKSVSELVSLSVEVVGKMNVLTAWMPLIDNDLITDSLTNMINDETLRHTLGSVDYLLGMCASEGTSIASYRASIIGIDLMSLDFLPYHLVINLSILFNMKSPEIIDLILHEYWENDELGARREMTHAAAVDFLTDLSLYAAYYTAKVHRKMKGDYGTYLYKYNHIPRGEFGVFPPSPWVQKAVHGDELPMMFGLPHSKQNPRQDPVDARVSREMMTYWTNFAKSGNPNTPVSTVPNWPDFDQSSAHLSITSQGCSARTDFMEAKRLDLWDRILPIMEQRYPWMAPSSGYCNNYGSCEHPNAATEMYKALKRWLHKL